MMVTDNMPRARRTSNGSRAELRLPVEAPPEERAAERRATRMQLRMYCVMCGRSATVSRAPAHPGRCLNCGGTMLIEFDPA
jgi:hypothetical protein